MPLNNPGYPEVQDEGIAVAVQPKINFVGDGVTAEDDPTNGRTKVTIPGGGTPSVHATSHQNGGSDEISVAGLSGTLADPQTPSAHKDSHDPEDGADALDTAAGSTQALGDSAATGTSHSLSRADHKHAMPAAAAASDLNTGTDTAKPVTSDAVAGSVHGMVSIEVQVVAVATDVDTTSGVGYFNIPSKANGMNLVRAQAYVDTAGTTNATTVQVRNMTKYASNDALSGAISIASGDITGTVGTVDTDYDDVATDDLIKVYVTGQSTTKPKGLRVLCEYRLP